VYSLNACFSDEPDSPGTPEIVDHDRHRIDLKWAKPISDGGNPIKGYIIERKEMKSNRWIRVNPDSLCKVRQSNLSHEQDMVLVSLCWSSLRECFVAAP
jgi:hypothetical protein